MTRKDTQAEISNRAEVGLRWLSTPKEMPRVVADEVAISVVGEKVYLTFGEVVPPEPSEAKQPISEIALNSVARVTLSESSFLKLRNLVDTIANRISAANGTKGEESQ